MKRWAVFLSFLFFFSTTAFAEVKECPPPGLDPYNKGRVLSEGEHLVTLTTDITVFSEGGHSFSPACIIKAGEDVVVRQEGELTRVVWRKGCGNPLWATKERQPLYLPPLTPLVAEKKEEKKEVVQQTVTVQLTAPQIVCGEGTRLEGQRCVAVVHEEKVYTDRILVDYCQIPGHCYLGVASVEPEKPCFGSSTTEIGLGSLTGGMSAAFLGKGGALAWIGLGLGAIAVVDGFVRNDSKIGCEIGALAVGGGAGFFGGTALKKSLEPDLPQQVQPVAGAPAPTPVIPPAPIVGGPAPSPVIPAPSVVPIPSVPGPSPVPVI